MASDGAMQRSTVRVVFLSLLLDLLAFTIPLPLFPRLVDDFLSKERFSHHTTLLSGSLSMIRLFSSKLIGFSKPSDSFMPEEYRKWDVTLLGGALGSIFSLAQFIISPSIGKLSDRIGRKPVLLLTMLGNIISAVLWFFSTSFDSFLLARIVGGLCEGNVQLAIAIISDVSAKEKRARSLALVGLAFSIAFTTGPPLGAYFAARPLDDVARNRYLPVFLSDVPLNIYATPALVTAILLTIETIYLYLALPETLPSSPDHDQSSSRPQSPKKQTSTAATAENLSPENAVRAYEDKRAKIDVLNRLHFSFLFFFSGCEFSLTFLCYDLFRFTNMQNGKLLGYIGVLSALLQGGYVRRIGKPAKLSKTGLLSCSLAFGALSILPFFAPIRTKHELVYESNEDLHDWKSASLLYTSATLLAYTSATVVTSLNALTSIRCDDVDTMVDGKEFLLPKGEVLGRFRSVGQLGRALGPIFATLVYWSFGPSIAYGVSAAALTGLWVSMGKDWEREEKVQAATAAKQHFTTGKRKKQK